MPHGDTDQARPRRSALQPRARSALDQGKVEEAIAEIRAAIRLDPQLSEAYYNLGNALHADGNLDEAISEYRAAIRCDRDFAGAHHNLGAAPKPRGISRKPSPSSAVVRLDPDEALGHFSLASALAEQGQREKAIAVFRKAGDNAPPGSKLAQFIERALTELHR